MRGDGLARIIRRRKAEFDLRATERGVEIHDLDSTNGLWFEERAVSGVRLQDGDSFRAGTCKFVLLDSGDREVELIDARERGTSIELSAKALEALRRHDWPGNVRELRNTVSTKTPLEF